MAPTASLGLKGVRKSYGSVLALDDVSFEVQPGEAVGYLGPNGAGKTTTLKLLCGLTAPTAGSVFLAGANPTTDRRGALRNAGVLVETPGVLPYVRARDMLRHAAELKGVAPGDRAGAIQRAARTLGIEPYLDQRLSALSTGWLRRVLLAFALVGDPPILILDEPTMGLDPAARADLRTTLRELHTTGRTLLVSTHLLEDVEEVCDRVLFLRSGKLVGDEGVRSAEPATSEVRFLDLELFRPVEVEELRRACGAGVRVAPRGDKGFRVSFEGGDERQGELVRALAAANIPVLAVHAPKGDLAARYLAKVGREGDA